MMGISLDVSKIIQFVKQNLPIAASTEYYKVSERVVWFIKKSHEDNNETIANFSELASDEWHWKFTCLEIIRTQWIQYQLNELLRIMHFLKTFVRINILQVTADSNIRNWVGLLEKVIKNSLTEGIGLVYYLADIYVEIVKDLPFSVISQLVQPFVNLISDVTIYQISEMVHARIFMRIKNLKIPEFNEWILNIAKSK